MGRLVMKFGGTSVANIDRIRNAARHVKREVDAGHDVAVVVSAMAGKTNELVEWCRDASPMHDAREYDAVVASGEQVTAGLLAIVLQGLGIQARSWQGWQIPIRTSDAHASARILEIDGADLINRFRERKEVAVIAGFQGINPQTGRITTLGRGGSDTTAVALAAALEADLCEIYTDVPGVFTADPRVVPTAHRIPRISFEEMLEIAATGGRVLSLRSVEFARNHHVPLLVRSSFTWEPGTVVTEEDPSMEQPVVSAVTHDTSQAKITLSGVADRPGIAAALFRHLADRSINVDMIVQNISHHGTTDISFTVPRDDVEASREVAASMLDTLGAAEVVTDEGVATVSLVGAGMKTHPGVTATMFETLAAEGINIEMISTSPIRISCMVRAEVAERAVQVLHGAFELDAPS